MPNDPTPIRLPLASLPAGAAPVERPGAARIHAVGIGDPEKPTGFAALRQRRTSQMMMIIAWSCPPEAAPVLARAVLAFCGDGARLIRALPDQAEAIDSLGLRDSGRGYFQRWLGPEIVSRHETGQYVQSTGFTCGPVSLAMAMGQDVTRSTEIAIWREATTMIGHTGPGGCDPYGVALAARRRGFEVELWFDSESPVLLDRANTEEKKDLMRFVQSEFRTEAEAILPIHRAALSADELTRVVRGGSMVILLIDQCHTHDHHAPHWVLVHAEQDGSFLVNDPWAEPEDGETVADVDCIPIACDTLMRMGSYGDPAYHAALVLRRVSA